jgi:hypothetical protein
VADTVIEADFCRQKTVAMGSHLRWPVKNLEFDPAAFEDLMWWVEYDRQKALRILRLIQAEQPAGRRWRRGV